MCVCVVFFLPQTLSTVFGLPCSVLYCHDRAAFSRIRDCAYPLKDPQELSSHSSPRCS